MKKTARLDDWRRIFLWTSAGAVLVVCDRLCQRMGATTPLDAQVMLAALAIGHLIGEGLGRLACLSFGRCYGKSLDQCGALTVSQLPYRENDGPIRQLSQALHQVMSK